MSQPECLYYFFTQQNILYFLKHIEALRDSSKVDFYNPVLENPQLREVHEAYKRIVTNPTSLKRIKEKCLSNQLHYPLVGHFLLEFRLLINNALLFNNQDLKPEIMKFEEKVIEVFPLYKSLKDDFLPFGYITIPPAFLQMLAGRMLAVDPVPALYKVDVRIEADLDLKTLSFKKFWNFSKYLLDFEDEKLDFSVYREQKSMRTSIASVATPSAQNTAPSKSFQDILRSRLEQRAQDVSGAANDESTRAKEQTTPFTDPSSAAANYARQAPEIPPPGLSFAEIMRLRYLKQKNQ